MPELLIGTSAFTATGWETTFYPPGLKDADRLTFYATKFNTVEVDSTFYRTPARTTVRNWYAKTPADFVFALKVPQVITHEKVLHDCDDDLKLFLESAGELGEKLGPILFQFGYFNRTVFQSGAQFLERLKPFLARLPRHFRFAVEIRNKAWLDARFLDILRERGIAWAWLDQSWMPRPWEVNVKAELLTADFAYVRLLGDRKGIEQKTKVWDKVIVNRSADLRLWTEFFRKLAPRLKVYTYVNNHYAGYAPATATTLLDLWKK